MQTLAEAIVGQALALGFVRAGIADVRAPLPHAEELAAFVGRGYAGSMTFLDETREQRHLPQSLLGSAAAAVMVLGSYESPAEQKAPASALPVEDARLTIARYARGADYHRVLRTRLSALVVKIRELTTEPFEHYIAVDTAPLLERELAVRAGLGFIGKNTMLITPGLGSYTVVGSLLLSLPLPALAGATVAARHRQARRSRCGRCTRCLDACPNQALVAPYVLDARRCIAYLTIEHRDPIAAELVPYIGPALFGCDRCQEVCPYNARAGRRQAGDPELIPATSDLATVELMTALRLTAGPYRRLTRGRALARASHPMLLRNAVLAAATLLPESSTVNAALCTLLSHPRREVAEAARLALSYRETRPR